MTTLLNAKIANRQLDKAELDVVSGGTAYECGAGYNNGTATGCFPISSHSGASTSETASGNSTQHTNVKS